MDTDHIAELFRELRVTPSRRAVSTAVVALAASTALAPFFDRAGAGGKGNGKKKGKKKKKKNNPKDLIPPRCALGEIDCLGDPFDCCATQLCTACGCCPATKPSCCGTKSTINRLCYSAAGEMCCPPTAIGLVGTCAKGTFCGNPIADVPFCCVSGSQKCSFGCCPQGLICCKELGLCCDNPECVNEGEFGRQCHPIVIGTPARIA